MNTFIKSLFLITLLSIATNVQAQKRIKGDGNVSTDTRNVGNFDGVSVGGAWKITLKNGEEGKVEITTDANIIHLAKAEVKGNVLYIGWTNDYSVNKVTKMEMTIYFEDLEKIRVSGACTVVAEDEIAGESLELESSGASRITLMANVKEFKAGLSGAGKVTISGRAKDAKMGLSGAGSFNGFDFEVESLKVSISGAGSARVHCTEELRATVSGAGSVKYKGSPEVSKSISGAGSVRQAAY